MACKVVAVFANLNPSLFFNILAVLVAGSIGETAHLLCTFLSHSCATTT